MRYPLIFLLGLTIDLIYVWYIQAVMEHTKLKAGVLSVMLAAPAMFGWFEVYEDKWLAIPYFAGLFCGTVLAMELKGGGRQDAQKQSQRSDPKR